MITPCWATMRYAVKHQHDHDCHDAPFHLQCSVAMHVKEAPCVLVGQHSQHQATMPDGTVYRWDTK